MPTGIEKLKKLAGGVGKLRPVRPIKEFPKPPKDLTEFGPPEFRAGFAKYWKEIDEWRKALPLPAVTDELDGAKLDTSVQGQLDGLRADVDDLQDQPAATNTTVVISPPPIDIIGYGLQSIVFIANRTDGLAGVGTIADPRDGSTPDKFSAVMNSIPEYSDIVVLPGSYNIYGWSYAFPSRSFTLKQGQRIRGCGMERSTLKLVGAENTTDARYFMLHSPTTVMAGIQYVNEIEVGDMTLDLNMGGQIYPAVMMSACHLWGNNHRIHHVKVKNFGNKLGDHNSTAENFLLVTGGSSAGVQLINNIIEDCVVVDPYEIHIDSRGVTAIQVSGDAPTGRTITSIVRRNFIDGTYPDGYIPFLMLGGYFPPVGRYPLQAIGLGSGTHCRYEDNHVMNTGTGGPYLDTGLSRTSIVRGNTFFNINYGPTFHLDSSSPYDRLVIEDNHITLMRPSLAKPDGINIDPNSAAWPAGIFLGVGNSTLGAPYGFKEVSIRRNHINMVDESSDVADYSIGGIFVQDAEQVTIEDNVIRLPNMVGSSVPSIKSHIVLNTVGRAQCRNNIRPEDNSIILPWVSDLSKYWADEEYEQHKEAARSLMGW